ncbi:MAG: ferritin family protein, partial [Deltaproteobacteria bacterium]|nr:ferritin family protein [Deltaproteobacteria bacterium]
MFSAKEIIELAIKIEKNGEAVYRSAIEKVPNPGLVPLLEWMADEEVKHANWFAELKHNLETKNENPFVEEMGHELFNEMLGDKNFSLKDVDFATIEEIDDLIETFIEFEKDSIIFYEVLKPFVEDPVVREYLNKIIDEEKHHIELLKEITDRK